MRKPRKINKIETFVDFGDDIYLSVSKQGDNIVVNISHYAVNKTVIKCEDVGIPGVIGPDVEFTVKDAVKHQLELAEQMMVRK